MLISASRTQKAVSLLVMIALVVSISAISAPDRVQAASATWKVQVGGIVPQEGLAFNSYLPNDITVVEGDTVDFKIQGFHTVSLLSGAERPPDIVPLDDGRLAFPTEFFVPSGPRQQEYDGTGFVNSALPDPAAGPPKPFSVTFTAAGTYEIVCLVHLPMKANITVLPAGSELPTTQADVDAAAKARLADLKAQADKLKATTELVVSQNDDGSRDYEITAGLAQDDFEFLSFFPNDVTIYAGETVTWETAHTEVPTTIIFPSGAPLPEVFLVEPQEAGPPLFVINPALVAPSGGDTYSGTGLTSSGLLPGAAGPPGVPTTYTLKFDTPGSYPYGSPFGEPFQQGRINVVPAPDVSLPSVGDAAITPMLGALAGILGLSLILGGGYLARRRVTVK